MDVDQQNSTAPHPFNDPKADIVLKTSDGVEVRTHKLLLSLVSPVFESMFTLPQPMEPQQQDTIGVSEDSKSLVKVLRWCDPRASPSMDVVDLLDALILADKYDMACIVAKVQEQLLKLLEANEADRKAIFSIFAVAYKLRLEDLVRLAARGTLMTAGLEKFPQVKELELIPASALHQLTKYHAACRQSLSFAIPALTPWSCEFSPLCRFRNESSDMDCAACVSKDYGNPQWLESYVDKLDAYFKQPGIVPSAVYALNKVTGEEEEEAMAKCSKCKRKIREFREMREELAESFDDYVQQNVTFDPPRPESSIRT